MKMFEKSRTIVTGLIVMLYFINGLVDKPGEGNLCRNMLNLVVAITHADYWDILSFNEEIYTVHIWVAHFSVFC